MGTTKPVHSLSGSEPDLGGSAVGMGVVLSGPDIGPIDFNGGYNPFRCVGL